MESLKKIRHKYGAVNYTSQASIQNTSILLKNKLSYKKRLLSKKNNRTYVLPVEEIIYFEISDGIISAIDLRDKKFPLNFTTLLELEEGLDPLCFFRINRGEIINIEFIEHFEIFYKDRVSISLKQINRKLITSNSRAADFRKWIAGEN